MIDVLTRRDGARLMDRISIKTFLFGLVGLGIVFMMFKISWVGHLASDDLAYIETAQRWFSDFPVIPTSHWATRHTVTIPMGFSFLIFGYKEISYLVPNILYGALTLLLIYFYVQKQWDKESALFCLFIIAMTPLFSEIVTIGGPESSEMFFAMLSIILFTKMADQEGGAGIALLTGVVAGFAFMNRETAISIIFFYSVLFLVRPIVPRKYYFIMAGGFCLVIGLEALYYGILSGKPFLRFSVAIANSEKIDVTLATTGNITHNRWLGPVASLMINNEFGCLFWMAFPAMFTLLVRRNNTDKENRFLFLVLLLSLIWFLIIGYLLGLRALPRYFLVTCIGACVFVGIWLRTVVFESKPLVAWSLLLVLVSTNLALADLANQQPLIAERKAVQLAVENPDEIIYTDPRTAWRTKCLAEWAGIDKERIRATAPTKGSLYVYSPYSVDSGRSGVTGEFERDRFRPSEKWELIRRYKGAPTIIGRILIGTGLSEFIHKKGLDRLIWEAKPIMIYRT